MSQVVISNEKEKFCFDKVARGANGSVWYEQGKAVLIATVVADRKAVEDDFLPLTVQYIEKSYAAAKIPGGFIKRESKPSDFETLTSRIIDRSLRPLFPKGFNYPITITVLVLSSDSDVDMQLAATHAANAALLVSSLPIKRSIATVRIALVDNNVIINPTLSMQQKSTLDLLVTGAKDEVLMIEMRSIGSVGKINELSEEYLCELIEEASSHIKRESAIYEEQFLPLKKEELIFELFALDSDKKYENMLLANYTQEIREAIFHMAKSERSVALKELQEKIESELQTKGEAVDSKLLEAGLLGAKAKVMRQIVLNEGKRVDGRGLDEVRAITIETNLLPSVHGSTLFTRGQTQALATITLGDKKDAQSYELITEKNSLSENFMVHYNFPGFSVGDSKPIGPTNRRELGHGNLAKRALECSVDLEQNQSVRVVSEILESNGSSSMATVCAGSLALACADVQIKSLIAGVAMGLIKDESKYAILTDIMGLEDFEGDMDFKVAGPKEGITALQMDIKLDGISVPILKEALMQAKSGKNHILSLMEKAKEDIIPSQALPKSLSFEIPVSKIGDVIGKAGATIREIIERFDVTIDINKESGIVKITGFDNLEGAKEYIQTIVNSTTFEPMIYEQGVVYQGRVKKIADFGLFVQMPDGYDALLHISKVAKGRVDNLHNLYKIDDEVDVVVLEQSGKKIELATPAYLS